MIYYKMWKDCGNYYLNEHEQGTAGWLSARIGRITMSNAYATGGKSRFSTIEEVADQTCNIREKKINETQRKRMERGSRMEGEAREFYEKQSGNTVYEVGLGVNKHLSPYIGGSPDGLVDHDGLIEIKNPDVMYQALYLNQRYKDLGIETDPNDFEHIWPSHYAQMQGNMAIFERKWCDYIVYISPINCIIQRVPFNAVYWEKELLPQLNRFVNEYLKPRIIEHKIVVDMPDGINLEQE